MPPLFRIILTSALILPALSLAGQAEAAPKLQGKFGDWSVYTRTEGGDTICYALSKPKTKSPSSVNHGDIYFMVASWKSGIATEQPSFKADFPLKPENPPKIIIGSQSYRMYVSDNEAFIEQTTDEKSLVKAMRGGAVMNIRGKSTRGTSVAYSFSLKGITAALNKTKKIC